MESSESRAITDFLGTLSTGTFEADYTFLETVGEGGYGKVYKVVSKKDHQTYAVKKVRFDQHRRKTRIHLIKRELINNAKLSHENVVRYYDSWIEASADQSLDRTDSTDSDTDYSESNELNSDVTDHSDTDELNTNDRNDAEIELTKRKNTEEQTQQNEKTEEISYKCTSNIRSVDQSEHISCEANIESLGSFGVSGTDKSKENDTEEVPSELEAGNINAKYLTEQRGLPDFHMLQIELENSSTTSAEDEQADTHADADVVFDENAPSDGKGDNNNTNIDIEEDDEFDGDLTDEDKAQMLMQDASKLDEILKQVSDSVRSDDKFDNLAKQDRDSDRTQESAESTGPRYLDLYIKMEFCDQTLKEAIDDNKLVNNDDKIWTYFRQIVRGLNYIHNKGITHRDLNPRNIFITRHDVVKIGDFGLSRLHVNDESDFDNLKASVNGSELQKQSKSGMTGDIGTVWYSAPEVLGKSSCVYGHEIDLFSLGLIFFEMCHVPFGTGREKAEIFQNLRKDRSFPDSFDRDSKAKQTKVITNLLHPNPEARVPLKKLMDPSEGFVVPEPVEEHHFKIMLPEVIAKPEGELYQIMISQLFRQKNGKCWSSFDCQAIPKHVAMINQAFVSVAESRGVRGIHLPLFVPLKESVSTDIAEVREPIVFLDPQGQPVMLSDSSLRSFIYELERYSIPLCNTFYSNQPEYKTEIGLNATYPVNLPNIHYFSLSENNDVIAIGKALLILQQSLEKSGHGAEEFVLGLSHASLEDCLVRLYKLGETEQKILNVLFEEVGGSTRRQKLVRLLKKTKQYHFAMPEDLAATGSVQKMTDKLKICLRRVQKSDPGLNEELYDRVHNSLNSIRGLEDVLAKIGVAFDVKVEIFIRTPQVGATDAGIKFRLRSKPKMDIVARGGQFEMAHGDSNAVIKLRRELFWYELDAYKLKKTGTDSDKTDVVILYDNTKVDEVKNTAYLYGKLTSIGFLVSQVMKNENIESGMHISPWCKVLIRFNAQGTVVHYDDGSKLKAISMNVGTVVNHLKKRKGIPRTRFFTGDLF